MSFIFVLTPIDPKEGVPKLLTLILNVLLLVIDCFLLTGITWDKEMFIGIIKVINK